MTYAEDAPKPIGSVREMLARLGSKWGVPLSAGLEISDRCNEVCVHCYQEQGRKGEMTTEQIFRVMDELADMGVLLLTLSGGEATLRKDFLELVAYAREKQFAVRLFTNGLTMTRELAQALGALAVQNVEISLYSVRASTHDFVTGVPGSFERTVAGIRNLVEAGVSVTAKTPVMSMNEHEMAEYAAFVESLGAAYSVSPGQMMPREGGSRYPEVFQVSAPSLLALLCEIDPAPSATCGVKPVRPLDSKPCGAGEGLHIEPNGELRPCTMLDFDLGDATREGVAVAFQTNERARLMRTLTWASLHGCRDCDLRSYCTHCYASARAQTGDAMGPYEGGCHLAQVNFEARSGRTPQFVNGATPASLGPYREIAVGVFECAPHVVTTDDDALAEQLGWARSSAGPLPAPGPLARPGELIQIRRPGQKKPQLGRIPTWTKTAGVAVAPADHEIESRSNVT